MKVIRLVTLLIPISFLIHYLETSHLQNHPGYVFTGAFLLMILAGVLSIKIKLRVIFSMTGISILLSISLGSIFITPPNESWFNPFGMNFAIVSVGVIILVGILVVRGLASTVIKSKPLDG